MYAPVIGNLNEYECSKCGDGVRWLLPFSFAHDIACWSLKTALYNAYVRVFRPRYFIEECCTGVADEQD